MNSFISSKLLSSGICRPLCPTLIVRHTPGQHVTDKRLEMTNTNNLLTTQNKSLIENSMIYKNYSIKKEMKLIEDKIFILNQKMDDLKNQINTKSEEDKDDGLIGPEGSNNIWEALERGSFQDIYYFYIKNPSSIHRRNENYYYNTPLHYASEKGYIGITKFFLSKGVEVDPMNLDNVTPLMRASQNGHFFIVKYLLDKCAKVNHQESVMNWTPLHWAVWGNHLEIVKLLIERGADKKLGDKYNRTPLDKAKTLGASSSFINYLSSQ